MFLDKSLKKEHLSIATWLAFFAVPMSGLVTDIYIPSMPSMAKSLHHSESEIQLTLTFFLISYGVVQLFAGSIVDTLGRYKVSVISLFLLTVSLFATAYTENLNILYTNRVIQGLSVGALVVAKRAYFVDVYEGEKLKSLLSIITIIWSVGPIIAPFIGGYLQNWFGWEANFIFIGIYCLILFLLELKFGGETIKKRLVLHLKTLANEMKYQITTRDFLIGLMICGVSFSMVIFFNLSGPFILEHKMHLNSIQLGYVSLLMGIGWMLGGFLGKWTIKYALLKKLQVGILFQSIFIIMMYYIGNIYTNIFSLIGFAFIIHTTAGYLFNNYFGYCLGRFPHAAGIAGGLTGGGVYVITSFISYRIAAMVELTGQTSIAVGYGLCCVVNILFIMYLVLYTKKHHMIKSL